MNWRSTFVATICIFFHLTLPVLAETSGLKDEADLSRAIAPENDEFDGGFSSLEGMLQWAISHSDHAKLRNTAQNSQHLSANDLKKRQEDIKELMNQLKVPSDAQLMQIALNDLNNASISSEERHRVLEEILVFVESIDNANDLHKLGVLTVIVQALESSDNETRIRSAWILGKASQNNPVVQKQILNLGALAKLMEMVNSNGVEEASKALYAVSALIRNNLDGQELFYAKSGELILQGILSNSNTDVRLRKKSAFLVADLAVSQLESENKEEPSFFSNPFFMRSVVELVKSSDLDLQEKALIAVKSLLQLRTTKASDFKDFCGLDGALEGMREGLKQLMAVENVSDFARDLENLLIEVELIFQRKLQQDAVSGGHDYLAR
ncbi:hypothetical protein Syun_013803 [Stephania yunnanensis]|uniref:Nucleotide exchange factor Fes1 domain-containing protein n=1 Tax=Stephania yunnanensis TaxID=152371 RepID=A0AAP0JI14_9MAGN